MELDSVWPRLAGLWPPPLQRHAEVQHGHTYCKDSGSEADADSAPTTLFLDPAPHERSQFLRT